MSSFNVKEWVDRASEYPMRRKLVKENGSTEIVTVERYEGTITDEGDNFSSQTMDDLETRIDSAFESVEKLAIKNITRSGVQFTATRLDGTTFNFTQRDTTYNNFQGALASKDGVAGLVPAPRTGERNYFLSGGGVWAPLPAATNMSTGAVPILTSNSRQFLDATGAWAEPPLANIGQRGSMRALNNNTATFMRGDGNWAEPVKVKTSYSSQATGSMAANSGKYLTIGNKPSGTILACIPVGTRPSTISIQGARDSSLAKLKNGEFYIVTTSAVTQGYVDAVWIYY